MSKLTLINNFITDFLYWYVQCQDDVGFFTQMGEMSSNYSINNDRASLLLDLCLKFASLVHRLHIFTNLIIACCSFQVCMSCTYSKDIA